MGGRHAGEPYSRGHRPFPHRDVRCLTIVFSDNLQHAVGFAAPVEALGRYDLAIGINDRLPAFNANAERLYDNFVAIVKAARASSNAA